MLVIDEMVETLRDAGFANVYPMQLPAKANEGIVVRLVTSLTTGYYMDGTRVEDVTYQVIARRRSGAEANGTAEEIRRFVSEKLPNCKGCKMIANDWQLLPQQLQLSESGYFESMVQFVAEIETR